MAKNPFVYVVVVFAVVNFNFAVALCVVYVICFACMYLGRLRVEKHESDNGYVVVMAAELRMNLKGAKR